MSAFNQPKSKFISQLLDNKFTQPIKAGSIAVSEFHSEVVSGTGYLQVSQYDDPQCNVASSVIDYILNVCIQYGPGTTLFLSNYPGSDLINATFFANPNCTDSTMAQSIPISGTCNSGSTLKLFDGTSSLPPSPFVTNYESQRYIQYYILYLILDLQLTLFCQYIYQYI